MLKTSDLICPEMIVVVLFWPNHPYVVLYTIQMIMLSGKAAKLANSLGTRKSNENGGKAWNNSECVDE